MIYGKQEKRPTNRNRTMLFWGQTSKEKAAIAGQTLRGKMVMVWAVIVIPLIDRACPALPGAPSPQ